MKDKEIILEELIGIARIDENVRVGIPFAKGELSDPNLLVLLDENGETHILQIETLNRWADESLKWVLVEFQCSLGARQKSVWRLKSSGDGKRKTNKEGPPEGFTIAKSEDCWVIDTGKCRFHVDVNCFRPFKRVQFDETEILTPDCSGFSIRDENGESHIAQIDSMCIENSGPIRLALRMQGHFPSLAGNAVIYICTLHFFRNSSLVRMGITIRNPRPSRHPGGLWDLGDPSSFYFRGLEMLIHLASGIGSKWECNPEMKCRVIAGSAAERLLVYQESSGGINRQSLNHRNGNGEVPFSRKGYEISVDERMVINGERVDPILWIGSGEYGVGMYFTHFWQNFPKAMEAAGDRVKLDLFPCMFPDIHELQGGEQKSHTAFIDFHVRSGDLDWARFPLRPAAAPDVIRSSGAVPNLPGKNDLVDRFVSGPEDILKKRESLDEYGWRNFGDVYADHEATYHKGSGPFVSHYNNQYDLIAGAYRKYMTTGNSKWRCLASDLSKHVNDIDIYHTDADREEYDNGLFWHTDHYKQAGLSTHRSFSRENADSKKYGGGPGAEHCYTTGLALHYFLTGESEFRQAVLNLADWCLRSLNGPQTILAALRRGIGNLAKLCTKGNSRCAFPRYPMSRGTGNAITACLDAFEVAGGRYYVDQVEEIILGTLHPGDEIQARDLLNPEMSWSYTVLLEAIAKYLDKKQEMEEFDQPYEYARRCLLAYAEWMIGNEYSYLDKPEVLEYPTETWAAQDLRKSVVLFHAARYAAPDQGEAFRKKGLLLYEAASEELSRHSTSTLTRPLALMLQNGWIGARLQEEIIAQKASPVGVFRFGDPTPFFCLQSVVTQFIGDFMRSLRYASLKREVAWVRARIMSRSSSPHYAKWNQ